MVHCITSLVIWCTACTQWFTAWLYSPCGGRASRWGNMECALQCAGLGMYQSLQEVCETLIAALHEAKCISPNENKWDVYSKKNWELYHVGCSEHNLCIYPFCTFFLSSNTRLLISRLGLFKLLFHSPTYTHIFALSINLNLFNTILLLINI